MRKRRCILILIRPLLVLALEYNQGLSFDTNEKVLKDAFSLYGEILEVRVITNRASGMSKGFGFVLFASETDAVKALKEMDGRSLDGRNIRVHFANTRVHSDGAPPRV